VSWVETVSTFRVAVTGGSSSGKSFLTRHAQARFPDRYHCLPEVASLVLSERQVDQRTLDTATRESIQLEIYHRQITQEAQAPTQSIVLCDRGTIDASSYWPRGPEHFWAAASSTLERELARYRAVIWLESAAAVGRYRRNRIRTEDAEESKRHGEVLRSLWSAHPRVSVVRANLDFSVKVHEFLSILDSIRTQLP
jgi:predicted ATPase